MSETSPKPKPKKPSAIGRVLTAAGISFGLTSAAISLAESPSKPNQPTSLAPTPNGTKVPDGKLPPVGEEITFANLHPTPNGTKVSNPEQVPSGTATRDPKLSVQEIIQYGTEPNGQTLPTARKEISPAEEQHILEEQVQIPVESHNPAVDVGPTPGAPKKAPSEVQPVDPLIASLEKPTLYPDFPPVPIPREDESQSR